MGEEGRWDLSVIKREGGRESEGEGKRERGREGERESDSPLRPEHQCRKSKVV